MGAVGRGQCGAAPPSPVNGQVLTRAHQTHQHKMHDGAARAALPEPPRSGENKVTFLVSFLML